MVKIENLNMLKKKVSRTFYYKGMLFTLGGSSASSLSSMVIDKVDREMNLTINWTAYNSDGGDGSNIYLFYKAIGTKIVPYKVSHITKSLSSWK